MFRVPQNPPENGYKNQQPVFSGGGINTQYPRNNYFEVSSPSRNVSFSPPPYNNFLEASSELSDGNNHEAMKKDPKKKSLITDEEIEKIIEKYQKKSDSNELNFSGISDRSINKLETSPGRDNYLSKLLNKLQKLEEETIEKFNQDRKQRDQKTQAIQSQPVFNMSQELRPGENLSTSQKFQITNNSLSSHSSMNSDSLIRDSSRPFTSEVLEMKKRMLEEKIHESIKKSSKFRSTEGEKPSGESTSLSLNQHKESETFSKSKVLAEYPGLISEMPSLITNKQKIEDASNIEKKMEECFNRIDKSIKSNEIFSETNKRSTATHPMQYGMPRSPHALVNPGNLHKSSSEYHKNSGEQYKSLIDKNKQAPEQNEPHAPLYKFSTEQYRYDGDQQRLLLDHYRLNPDQYNSTVEQYKFLSEQLRPDTEQYKPVTEQYRPGTEQYRPGTEQYRPAAEPYRTATEQYRPTATELYRPALEQYRPTGNTEQYGHPLELSKPPADQVKASSELSKMPSDHFKPAAEQYIVFGKPQQTTLTESVYIAGTSNIGSPEKPIDSSRKSELIKSTQEVQDDNDILFAKEMLKQDFPRRTSGRALPDLKINNDTDFTISPSGEGRKKSDYLYSSEYIHKERERLNGDEKFSVSKPTSPNIRVSVTERLSTSSRSANEKSNNKKEEGTKDSPKFCEKGEKKAETFPIIEPIDLNSRQSRKGSANGNFARDESRLSQATNDPADMFLTSPGADNAIFRFEGYRLENSESDRVLLSPKETGQKNLITISTQEKFTLPPEDKQSPEFSEKRENLQSKDINSSSSFPSVFEFGVQKNTPVTYCDTEPMSRVKEQEINNQFVKKSEERSTVGLVKEESFNENQLIKNNPINIINEAIPNLPMQKDNIDEKKEFSLTEEGDVFQANSSKEENPSLRKNEELIPAIKEENSFRNIADPSAQILIEKQVNVDFSTEFKELNVPKDENYEEKNLRATTPQQEEIEIAKCKGKNIDITEEKVEFLVDRCTKTPELQSTPRDVGMFEQEPSKLDEMNNNKTVKEALIVENSKIKSIVPEIKTVDAPSVNENDKPEVQSIQMNRKENQDKKIEKTPNSRAPLFMLGIVLLILLLLGAYFV